MTGKALAGLALVGVTVALPRPVLAQADTTRLTAEVESLTTVIHQLEQDTVRDTVHHYHKGRIESKEAKTCSVAMVLLAGTGYLLFKDDRPVAAVALGTSALLGCLWD